jgi:hypothetical protein
VVFSEEIAWDPYFQKDPAWHKAGINDSLRRAAAKLPRVDAIGGSAAGVYVENRVRLASLFRGVPQELFESRVRDLFLELKKEWNGIPSKSSTTARLRRWPDRGAEEPERFGRLHGDQHGRRLRRSRRKDHRLLNELAFAPIDYREDAPVDEWSGDAGCGVQYFSQQGIGRLAAKAGIELPSEMPLPKKLLEVQRLAEDGDERALKVFESVGVCFGYTIAWYARFYEISKLLLLGRVSSGRGGDIVIKKAKEVLAGEFPELNAKIEFAIPDEKGRRHGQAIAAASLPALKTT